MNRGRTKENELWVIVEMSLVSWDASVLGAGTGQNVGRFADRKRFWTSQDNSTPSTRESRVRSWGKSD